MCEWAYEWVGFWFCHFGVGTVFIWKNSTINRSHVKIVANAKRSNRCARQLQIESFNWWRFYLFQWTHNIISDLSHAWAHVVFCVHCHCLCDHWNGNGTSFGWTSRWEQRTANGCFIFICGRQRLPHAKTEKSIGFERKTKKQRPQIVRAVRNCILSISIRCRTEAMSTMQILPFQIAFPKCISIVFGLSFLHAIANGMPCVREIYFSIREMVHFIVFSFDAKRSHPKCSGSFIIGFPRDGTCEFVSLCLSASVTRSLTICSKFRRILVFRLSKYVPCNCWCWLMLLFEINRRAQAINYIDRTW